MTLKKRFDSAEWQERLQIASDQLRTMVDELAALCTLRGADLQAPWCQQLVLAAAHAQEAFQHVEAAFEAEDSEVEAEPATARLVFSYLNG
jgi:hypothetical protein